MRLIVLFSAFFILPFFSVGKNIAPLPVELVDFNARPDGPRIALKWRTASEERVGRFEVERSIGSNQKFEQMDYLPAENKPAGADYALFDEKAPFNTPLYYRLKIVDNDGSFRYSPVREAMLKGAGFYAALIPNPARELVKINVRTNDVQTFNLVATNSLGQVVLRQQYSLEKGEQVLPIDLSAWPVGPYQFVISCNGEQQVLRMMHN
jgi:hypothetical protein